MSVRCCEFTQRYRRQNERLLIQGYTVFTTAAHRDMLEDCSRIIKRLVRAGHREREGVRRADRGPARRCNEEADGSRGGGGGARRSRLCHRRDAQRLVVGGRGRTGAAPERLPRGPGGDRDRGAGRRSGWDRGGGG